MEESWKQILNKLKNIEDHMSQLATLQELAETKETFFEELKRVSDTLETITAVESAVAKEKLEDKVEAGDVLLKSLIDGLEYRINQQMTRLSEQMEQGFKQVLQGLEAVASTQKNTAEILNAFVARFEYQDDLNDLLNERIKKQEEQTYFLRQRVKKLEKMFDNDAS